MNFSNYEDWKHCITVLCGIPLTPDYIEKRILDLGDLNNFHTRKFVNMWGEEHRIHILGWFDRAKQEFEA